MSLHVVISSLLLGKSCQQEDTGEKARLCCKPGMLECCYGRHANKQQGTARGNISPLTEKLQTPVGYSRRCHNSARTGARSPWAHVYHGLLLFLLQMKKCRMGEINWCVQLGGGRFRMEASFSGSPLQPDFFCTEAEKAENVLETICSLFLALCPVSLCKMPAHTLVERGWVELLVMLKQFFHGVGRNFNFPSSHLSHDLRFLPSVVLGRLSGDSP